MQFLKFSVFSGAVFRSSFQTFLAKAKKEDQEKQQAKDEKDNLLKNSKIRARKEFLSALDKWKKGNTAFKLTCIYENECKSQTLPNKPCPSKDISVSLILYKSCHGRGVDGVDYEYPPNLRRITSILVCLPVSSANVERVFSHLKLLYSKRWLHLNAEVVKQLMFLGQNKCLPTYTLNDFKPKKE